MLELNECGFLEEMGWLGNKLSPSPIVFYDFNGIPRYYDFIVYDAEKKPVGVVSIHAQKKASTIIRAISKTIPEYNTVLTKFNLENAVFFIDWMGNKYVGVLSKNKETPQLIINISTKNQLTNRELKEPTEREIIKEMELDVLPRLIKYDERCFTNVPEELLMNEETQVEVNFAKNFTVSQATDSLKASLERTEKEAQLYWNTISDQEKLILNTPDEGLTNSSKFLGRFFRRIFSKVDRTCHSLKKYDINKSYRKGKTDWCGPWACGYILYANQKVDKYDFFVDCAASVGELGVGNFSLRLLGKPMTPVEMSWSMPIASKNKIWINPVLCFADLFAYDQIKHYNKPALRLCGVNGSLHWTLAYGTRQTGSWLWRNYYFLQIDNGAKVGNNGDINNSAHYTSVDWWNPWLMVWD